MCEWCKLAGEGTRAGPAVRAYLRDKTLGGREWQSFFPSALRVAPLSQRGGPLMAGCRCRVAGHAAGRAQMRASDSSAYLELHISYRVEEGRGPSRSPALFTSSQALSSPTTRACDESATLSCLYICLTFSHAQSVIQPPRHTVHCITIRAVYTTGCLNFVYFFEGLKSVDLTRLPSLLY